MMLKRNLSKIRQSMTIEFKYVGKFHSSTKNVGLLQVQKTMPPMSCNQGKNHLCVIQHHPAEGPGELLHWAQSRNIGLAIYRADLGQLPEASSDPVILLGGPYSAQSGPLWLECERRWLREKLELGAPVLGICLGAQLLALTIGGTLHRLDAPEIGWNAVRFSNGEQHDVLQWHDDHFSIPPCATLLARNMRCEQMFSYGTTRIGMQFHAEWNADSVNELNSYFAKESPLPVISERCKFAEVSAWLYTLPDKWMRDCDESKGKQF